MSLDYVFWREIRTPVRENDVDFWNFINLWQGLVEITSANPLGRGPVVSLGQRNPINTSKKSPEPTSAEVDAYKAELDAYKKDISENRYVLRKFPQISYDNAGNPISNQALFKVQRLIINSL